MSAHFAIWFTGLPCSGKTTLAELLCLELEARGFYPQALDGDVLRRVLSPDLAFSRSDREEHGRRVTLLAASFLKEGRIPVVSLVSPYRSIRDFARQHLAGFVEIYTDCPLSVCEARDVKGMYRLARKGKIDRFTGISDDYEPPLNPDLVLRTDRLSPAECIRRTLDVLSKNPSLKLSRKMTQLQYFQ